LRSLDPFQRLNDCSPCTILITAGTGASLRNFPVTRVLC
jgi:hypothetical protein